MADVLKSFSRMVDGPASPPASAQQEGPRGGRPAPDGIWHHRTVLRPRRRQRHTVLWPQGENIAVRRCLPCVREGGAALCAVTEGLQIPAAVQECAYQPLSQPDGCQLPLHKGAKGRGTDAPEKRSPSRRQSSPPNNLGGLLLFLHSSAHAHTSISALARGSDLDGLVLHGVRADFCAHTRERRAQSRGNAGALPAPTVSPPP